MKTKTLENLIEINKSSLVNDLLELGEVNYCMVAPDGTVLFKNQSLEKLVPGEINAKQVNADSWKTTEEVMRTKKTITVTENYHDKYYTSIKKPLMENGECKGVLIFSFDITAQKQAEAAKRLFVESMSHDLRTPFSGCISATECLLDDLDAPKAFRKKFLGLILTSSKQLLNIFNQVLEMIALDKPKEKDTFVLSDLVEEVHELFLPALAKNKLKFVNHSTNHKVTINKLAIETIIISLLSNAVKYTKKGSISITCTAVEDTLIINVTDTGIGIAPEHHAMVFEQFAKVIPTYQLPNHQGMGRGLYLVKKHAEQLGGTVSMGSELGKGSRFSVNIPISDFTEDR